MAALHESTLAYIQPVFKQHLSDIIYVFPDFAVLFGLTADLLMTEEHFGIGLVTEFYSDLKDAASRQFPGQVDRDVPGILYFFDPSG